MNEPTTFPNIWAHKVKLSKPYDGEGYSGCTITVTAGLHWIRGNRSPHFSVTAEIRRPGRKDIDAGGALHDDILRHWPELAPVVALHLSDDNGVPMHAVENAKYWLGLTEWTGALDYDMAARHLRCSTEYARTLREDALQHPDVDVVGPLIDAMRPRRQAEATAATKLLHTYREES